MATTFISKQDILANVIHTDHRVLMVLDRMGIKLGLDNKTIEQVVNEYLIDLEAFLIILNLFCDEQYVYSSDGKFQYIPDFLKYLKNSHRYFMEEKIPAIQKNMNQLTLLLDDTKANMVNSFYKEYIEEVTEHIDYENEMVFPFIEEMYEAYLNERDPSLLLKEYDINIYEEHHDDIEDKLKDLKNILIRHLPQKEEGNLRLIVLRQLFELESDLNSHTRLEDEVLIPIAKELENQIRPLVKSH